MIPDGKNLEFEEGQTNLSPLRHQSAPGVALKRCTCRLNVFNTATWLRRFASAARLEQYTPPP
jgi:hypothetical protein